MTFLPSVIRAEYDGGYRIRLTFNDNSAETIDFRQWLEGPVFEPLKDHVFFRRFFLEGGTVAWPNGADIQRTSKDRPPLNASVSQTQNRSEL